MQAQSIKNYSIHKKFNYFRSLIKNNKLLILDIQSKFLIQVMAIYEYKHQSHDSPAR